jgi:hypothetical protein
MGAPLGGAVKNAPGAHQYRCPTYPPPAYGVSWRARAGGCLPYRIYEICGFAPETWVPRFSPWVWENSAVSLMVIRPTSSNVPLFLESSMEISLPAKEVRLFLRAGEGSDAAG